MQNQKEQKQIARKHQEEEGARKEIKKDWAEMQQTTIVCTNAKVIFIKGGQTEVEGSKGLI